MNLLSHHIFAFLAIVSVFTNQLLKPSVRNSGILKINKYYTIVTKEVTVGVVCNTSKYHLYYQYLSAEHAIVSMHALVPELAISSH